MGIKDKNSLRACRKDEHIRFFLEEYTQSTENGFEDIVLQNNSIPELYFDSIRTDWIFLGKPIGFPLMINAMTGGTDYTGKINGQLAELSAKYRIPIAAGSQTIAADDSSLEDTFRIIREINRDGVVVANVSANSSSDRVQKAIEMLDADAVQLHLNVPQEICMTEGDRDFRGILGNIEEIIRAVDKPVIVKEVGFGISYETAKRLLDIGVKHIDIGGKGGTNFISIENRRRKNCGSACRDFSFLEDWGIPTALSLLECRRASDTLSIICSGGVRKSEEIIKAVCMGADIAAVGGILLHELLEKGFDEADRLLESFISEARIIMLLLGARDIGQLKKVPFLIKGTLKELYEYKFA